MIQIKVTALSGKGATAPTKTLGATGWLLGRVIHEPEEPWGISVTGPSQF